MMMYSHRRMKQELKFVDFSIPNGFIYMFSSRTLVTAFVCNWND